MIKSVLILMLFLTARGACLQTPEEGAGGVPSERVEAGTSPVCGLGAESFSRGDLHRYLREVEAGREIGQEDAEWLVSHPDFAVWLETYPAIVCQISPHIHASYILCAQPIFEEWASEHPDLAEYIRSSAADWEAMTPEEQKKYLFDNPAMVPEVLKPYEMLDSDEGEVPSRAE